MKMKRNLILFSILVLTLLAIGGCTSKTTSSVTTTDETTIAAENLPVFTLEELAKYDGQNGNPVYVGYEGKVYDVSKIEAWKTGTHQGKVKSGQDLTDVLNNEAPHSSKNLTDNAPVVGLLE